MTDWDLWGDKIGISHEAFADGFDSFYTLNNEDPRKPFQADVKAELELFPEVRLTPIREWVARQDWS